MARRRKRSVSLGATSSAHRTQLVKWVELATLSLRNSQRAADAGKCRIAVTALVDAAKAVGHMNSEELALRKSKPSVDARLPPKRLLDIANVNAALEQTQSRLTKACRL